MSFLVVIPARFASQRLPGKPLKDIAGKPMIQRVYERAQASKARQVVVATDNEAIYEVVKAFGGEVCMTSDQHQSGTDRLEEVVQQLGLSDEEIVVNVQGDEPLIPPEVINQVAANLEENDEASCATLSEKIVHSDDVFNPNAVKVVCNQNSMALYFSRAAIPWCRDEFSKPANERDSENIAAQRHIGIYAYRVALLKSFVSWPLAELEKLEKLEQLRILANGHGIHVALACSTVPAGVDTEDDLLRVQSLFNEKS